MINFFNENNVLRKEQFGFRQNCSTTLATLNLIKLLCDSLNKRLLIAGVFFDMSKALCAT